METQLQNILNADAHSAGAVFSGSTFEVPKFQREYSWQDDEVSELWDDLSSNINSDAYFLGLIILTSEQQRKVVVDGQQRIVTLTLLATALYHEAMRRGRSALADRLQSTFLRSINYATDATDPRVVLSDTKDNATLQEILESGRSPEIDPNANTVSQRLARSFDILTKKLDQDLKTDPFKRLGRWADFLTNHVYFAVFVHPNSALAYQVFEVINTRGRALTTADLLKNYILSQTPKGNVEERYLQWQSIADEFPPEGSNNTFVQFIRHSVTKKYGFVLPKDLFGFLAQRSHHPGKSPPRPPELMDMLAGDLPLYRQMMDPTLSGPATQYELDTFLALNSLGVIAVRPILLAMHAAPDNERGIRELLRLVVRRIVVGNLGTGNVERRLGEVAKRISADRVWTPLIDELSDLNPSRDEFVDRLSKRTLSKGTLSFVRRTIIQRTITPENLGTLHFIWPKSNTNWENFAEQDSYWHSTLGNSFLSTLRRRPPEATESWVDFKASMFDEPSPDEWVGELEKFADWSPDTIEEIGRSLAEAAAALWY